VSSWSEQFAAARPGDFVIWDNQTTWHYAIDDYGGGPRAYRKVIGV
jgi:alpha-ketoglutarate-dependent taurine dioxygenase